LKKYTSMVGVDDGVSTWIAYVMDSPTLRVNVYPMYSSTPSTTPLSATIVSGLTVPVWVAAAGDDSPRMAVRARADTRASFQGVRIGCNLGYRGARVVSLERFRWKSAADTPRESRDPALATGILSRSRAGIRSRSRTA